jgi:pyruvate dehydrogenase E2 component (dihydrolipoamide acetyltransferase)
MIEFKLPDIGEGIAEGEIVQWLVAEGAAVEEHQPIVEVMTDKATVEVPAPAKGRVTKLLAKAGDTVPVGTVIFHLDNGAGGGAPKAAAGAAPEQPKASQQPAKAPQAPQKAAQPQPKATQEQAKAAPAKASAPAQPAAQSAGAQKAATPKAAARPASGGGGKLMEFKLPDIGEGIAEGEIVRWIVAEGATVNEHDPVVEVMTDKATVEVPAPAAGTIVKQLAAAGDTVPVGSVIFHLQTGAGAVQAAEGADGTIESEQDTVEDAGEGAGEGEAAEAAPAKATGAPARMSHADGKVLAVPSARRVARELDVDLASVSGTGRGGIVRRADVEAAAKAGATAQQAKPATAAASSAPATRAAASAPPTISAPPAAAAAASGKPAKAAAPIPFLGEVKRVPYRGIRRKTGEAMTRSVHTAAHFTVVEEIDVTELVELRNKAKDMGAAHGVNITYMPFIMKAVASGLTRFRSLNGSLDEAAGEIVLPNEINIGVATDTPNGLVVPVIRNVEQKGLLHLAAEMADLTERTRAGKVKPDELRGSTFTITNAGNIGGILATPIINFPDIAILGVHRIVKRPGVIETPDGDEIAVRSYMNLSCSVDHRLADGADAARFLAWMRTLLENPGLLSL